MRWLIKEEKMPKFHLSAEVTVSTYTTIEAETLEEAIEMAEEAIEMAEDRDVVIGGNCSGEDENYSWIVEEIDGEPEKIKSA
jgi:hypothetical protein